MQDRYVVQRRARKWFGRWETLWVDAADSPLYLPRIDTSAGEMYNAGRLAELVGRRGLRDGDRRMRVVPWALKYRKVYGSLGVL